jgi:hypothetical protein
VPYVPEHPALTCKNSLTDSQSLRLPHSEFHDSSVEKIKTQIDLACRLSSRWLIGETND